MTRHKAIIRRDEPETSLTGVIVTTSRGRRIECLPTQLVIDQVRELYEARKPSPPTYTIKDVAGAEEERTYTEKSITGPNVSDADKAAWQKYLDEVAAIDREYNEHVLRVIAVECVKILDMPPEEEWVKRHRWLYGNVIPDGHDERRYHYFKTEIIGTQQDGFDIMMGIHRASGVDKEVLDKLESSFRHPVENENGSNAGANQNDPTRDKSEAGRLVE